MAITTGNVIYASDVTTASTANKIIQRSSGNISVGYITGLQYLNMGYNHNLSRTLFRLYNANSLEYRWWADSGISWTFGNHSNGDYNTFIVANSTCYYYNATFTAISSREAKQNIVSMHTDINHIMQIEPVKFIYNNDTTESYRLGFVYEDFKKIYPLACFDKKIISKDTYSPAGIEYSYLVPFLLKEIQELRKRVEILKSKKKAQSN